MRSDDPTPPPDQTTAPHLGAIGAPIGGSVGRFRVDGMLGRGGMGIVLDAYDPELARAVAVKLLRPDVWGTATDVDRARLQREAQAMAKLSHPNVVTVYEVGEVDGQAFLAMEKVDGETLRAWQERRRTPAQLIAMYVAVGRGLAAAHAAGLVHRDFKPENVLVGRDGRGRVGDFGLVSAGVAIEAGDARDAPAGVNLTVRGSMMGTPAYMAPEQWAGEEIDARTDQFAFAVALWEASYGERPFAGTDGPTIRAAVLAGERRPPRRGAQAPSWLWPILVRALERVPDRRWPTLAAMLDELTRRSSPSRAPVVAAGAGAVLGTAAVVAALVTGPKAAGASCSTPSAAGVWDAPAQARLRSHLRELDPVRGQDVFVDLARFADRHVTAWQNMSVASCLATRSSKQSDTLHDQRAACLSARLDELAQTSALTLAVRDPGKLDRVATAWTELSPVADCSDAAMITGFQPPPVPKRREAAAIDAALRAIEVARRAGLLDGLQDRVAAALAQARTLDHLPLVAGALQEVALIATDRTDAPAAEAALYALTEIGARAGDDAIVADAWTRLVSVTAFNLAQPDRAQAIVPAARGAVARAGDRLGDRVQLAIGEADVDLTIREPDPDLKQKRYDQALERLRAARQQLDDAGAGRPDSPLQIARADVLKAIAVAHHRRREYAAAVGVNDAAIAAWDQARGKGHPGSAFLWINRGEALRLLDRKAESRASFEEAVRIRETRLGDSPGLAHALAALGGMLVQQRDEAAALPLMERAVPMARATMPDSNPSKISALNTLANVYQRQKRDAEARALLEEAIAIGDRGGARHTSRASAAINLGDLDARAGDLAGAVARFGRAARQFEELGDKDHPAIVQAHQRAATCLIQLGDLDGALATLDRAAVVKPSPSLSVDYILIDHLRGHALIASQRDPERGRALQLAALRAAAAHPEQALAVGQLKLTQSRIAPGIELPSHVP